MSVFLFGVGGVFLLFILLILLPIIMRVAEPDEADPGGNEKSVPHKTGERRWQGVKKWIWVPVVLIGVGAIWFFQPWTLFDWSTTTPGKAIDGWLGASWSNTVPGKAIDGWLGAGWSNWIMWLLVAILIYWLITKFFLKSKGSSDGVGGGAVTVMAFIALAAIVLSAVGSNYAREARSEVVGVDLRKAGERQPKETRLRLSDTARVTGGYVLGKDGRPVADGVTAYGICAKVVQPAWLLTHPSTPKKQLEFVSNSVGFSHDMEFTQEMKTFLAQNDVATVTVSFYLVLTTVGVAPDC